MVRLFIRTMSELVKRHILCIQEQNRYKSTKLKRAIIADADLLCALAECAYNILKNNIPLNDAQRQRLRKYRKQLRELSGRRVPAAKRRRILLQQQGQSGGFLSAFLAPLESSIFIPLLREVLFKKMEHARKMALVDPRLLDTLCSQPSAPPPTNTIDKKVQDLDDEMMSIFDRKNLDDRDKVMLYNQVLQRYNALSDKRTKEPISVVAVNESVPSAAAVAPREGCSGIEADVVDTVLKTMQAKARRLMEHFKRDITWTARGQLIHEGVPVAGSNVEDLVNDLLRKRKIDPTGWQEFAQQFKYINLLVGNVATRSYIHQAKTPPRRVAAASARRSLLRWTPLVRRQQMEQSKGMLTPPPDRRIG